MDESTGALALLLAIILITIISLSAQPSKQSPTASSEITAENIRIYWNPELTNETKTIDWGTLTPGQNRTHTLYLTYNSNTTLKIETSNWTPLETRQFMHLTWNQTQLNSIILTLHVSPHIRNVTDFSFNIIFRNNHKSPK